MCNILFRDDFLLVLEKPSGLLAVPGRGPDLQDCLSARVQAEFPTALVVHRLDRDTSGLMLMALDAATQRALGRQFEVRRVEKRYIAEVAGSPVEQEGLIQLPMRKDFDRPPCHRIDSVHGRPAQTAWRVIERGAGRTRMELRPITGRSHQIRLHLATIGHPIFGDPLYAPEAVQQMANRLLLHAAYVSFVHPVTGERCEWNSPCPF